VPTLHDDRTYKYDVALSFAGEQRDYVHQVADHLRENGVPVFYDDYEDVSLWGEDLYEHLHEVYSKLARYCVLFASAAYEKKVWTTHERRAAQVRALNEKDRAYILPARFDDTEIPGLNPTVKYVSCDEKTPLELADMIIQKLGGFERHDFFPNMPDRLFTIMHATTDQKKDLVQHQARAFFESLLRMDAEERKVVGAVLQNGCPVELPTNLHMSLDLLRRETGWPIVRVKEVLSGLRALGVTCSERDELHDEEHDHHWRGPDKQLVFEFTPLSTPTAGVPSADVPYMMVKVLREYYCGVHTFQSIQNADFGTLSSKVTSRHVHAPKRVSTAPSGSKKRARRGK
jgi:hypothetical protein